LEWRPYVDRDCPWVFPSPDGEMQKRCGKLFERIQLRTGTHLKAKDLRDYFCARTCERVKDPAVLMKLLRHKSLATTTQYITVTQDRLRAAVEGLGT